jgi:tetratricopeptide (TPR) repeat protein
MRIMVRRLFFFIALLVAATLAAARPLELPRPNEKWITLRMDEFTVVSNASPYETSAVARDLLRMRQAIGEITSLQVRSPKATKIFIFANERSFAPYRELVLRQNNESIRGAFITTDGGNFIVMKRDVTEEDIDRTVYHELTHYFVRNTVAGLPLWVSEGIAEYYSTFRSSGHSVLIGRPVTEHVQWLREETLIPFKELFATTVDSPIYNEGSRTGVFYAESWALFHYLMGDDARRAQLGQFLRLVGQAKPVDEAFAVAFGKPYGELEVELKSYVRKHAFAYAKYSLAEATAADVPKPEAISRDALLFELGHLLAYTVPQSPAEAQRFLDEALSVNASHAAAHADVGRLHYLAGRRQEASASLARAAELGSSDPQVHLLVGMTELSAFEGTRKIAAPTESILKARKAFERSAELDPESARAWSGIGATYVFTNEDPAAGVAALEKSLALAPGDINVTFQLVQLYARADRPADAQRLIDTVLSRGAKQQQLDFAREAVRRASVNAGVRRINEVIHKANDGKVEEAVKMLDEILPQLDDPEMQSKAKDLRAELASRLRK